VYCQSANKAPNSFPVNTFQWPSDNFSAAASLSASGSVAKII